MQSKLLLGLMAWQIGIAYKPQMGLEAGRGQSLRQPGNVAGNATSPGIGIRTLKGKDVELHWYVMLWPEFDSHSVSPQWACFSRSRRRSPTRKALAIMV
jgi:hypothetical protein